MVRGPVSICAKCGAETQDKSPVFCARCGAPFATGAATDGGATPQPGETSERSGRGEEILFEGRPAAIGSVGALLLVIVTVGIAAFFLWMRTLGRRYRITTERIVVELGVFSKRLEQIDLYRIQDFVVERSLGQRMMGTGTLILQTMDRTTPEVRIAGIRADVLALYESLRGATETQKRNRGVRLVDYE